MQKVKKVKSLKRIMLVSALILIIVGIFSYINKVTYPLILTLAETQVRKRAIMVINDACDQIKLMSALFEEYYVYERNNDGEIVLVRANTATINQVYLISQTEIQNAINKLTNEQIPIPIGALSGSSILANYGTPLQVNVMPIGTAELYWHSYFFHQGINQTIHRIVLTIESTIQIVIPIKSATVIVTTDLVLAEDIIVGRVPDSYITGLNNDHIFDLLP